MLFPRLKIGLDAKNSNPRQSAHRSYKRLRTESPFVHYVSCHDTTQMSGSGTLPRTETSRAKRRQWLRRAALDGVCQRLLGKSCPTVVSSYFQTPTPQKM